MSKRMNWVPILGLLACGWAVAAATAQAEQPPRLKTATAGSGAFSLAVPEGWQVTTKANRIDLFNPTGLVPVVSCKASPRQAGSLDEFALREAMKAKKDMPSWKLEKQLRIQHQGQDVMYMASSVVRDGAAWTLVYLLAVTPQHEILLDVLYPTAAAQRCAPVANQIVQSWRFGGAGGTPAAQPAEGEPTTPRPPTRAEDPPRVAEVPAAPPRQGTGEREMNQEELAAFLLSPQAQALTGGQGAERQDPANGPAGGAEAGQIPERADNGQAGQQPDGNRDGQDLADILGQAEEQAGNRIPMKSVFDNQGIFMLKVPASWTVNPFLKQGGVKANSPDLRITVTANALSRGVPFEQFVRSQIEYWKESATAGKIVGRKRITISDRHGWHFVSECEVDGTIMTYETILVPGPMLVLLLVVDCPKGAYPRHKDLIAQIIATLHFGTNPEPVDPKTPGTAVGVARTLRKESIEPGGVYSFVLPMHWTVNYAEGRAEIRDEKKDRVIWITKGHAQYADASEYGRSMVEVWKKLPKWKETERQVVTAGERGALLIRATAEVGHEAIALEYLLVCSETWQVCFTAACPERHLHRWREEFELIRKSLTLH